MQTSEFKDYYDTMSREWVTRKTDIYEAVKQGGGRRWDVKTSKDLLANAIYAVNKDREGFVASLERFKRHASEWLDEAMDDSQRGGGCELTVVGQHGHGMSYSEEEAVRQLADHMKDTIDNLESEVLYLDNMRWWRMKKTK